MQWLAIKYVLTALVVVLASEFARRSGKVGAFVGALPLISVLTLIWLYLEGQPATRLSSYAWFTLWYVVPSLPLFLVFPWLLPRFGFWLALLASIGVAVVCFGVFALVLRRFGIELL